MIKKEFTTYSLTESEFNELKHGAANMQKNEQRPIERQKIEGMRNLGIFLSRSLPTVQKLKNDGKIPFYNAGRKVFFFSDEVLDSLKSNTK